MTTRVFGIGLLVVLGVSQFAFAQEGKRRAKLSLDDVVTFRPTNGSEQSVVVRLSPLKTEQRTRRVSVQKFRPETRTRVVTVNGAQVQQVYTVNVPYTEMVEQSYSISSRPERVITVATIRAWDLTGKEIELEKLSERLKAPAAGFLLSSPWTKDRMVDKQHLAVLHPDTLLVHIASLRESETRQKQEP